MLGLDFWAIQVCLIVIMIVMTVLGECRHQDREQKSVRVEVLGSPPVPALDWELIGFTPRQRARLEQLRESVRAARRGTGALQDDIRAHLRHAAARANSYRRHPARWKRRLTRFCRKRRGAVARDRAIRRPGASYGLRYRAPLVMSRPVRTCSPRRTASLVSSGGHYEAVIGDLMVLLQDCSFVFI